MANKFWQDEVEVARIPKLENSDDDYGEYYALNLVKNTKGAWMLSLREWYFADSGGEWRPGKAGGVFPLHVLPRLAETLAKVEAPPSP